MPLDDPDNPRFMGCYYSSFKTHPAWKVLQPVLEANELFIEKPDSRPHIDMEVSTLLSGPNPAVAPDMEVHLLQSNQTAKSSVGVHVVSPASLKRSRRETTATDIEAFVKGHHCKNALIVLLCRDVPQDRDPRVEVSLDGLIDLYSLLTPILSKRVPVLPVFNPADFVTDIKDFMERDMGGTPRLPPKTYVCPFDVICRHAKVEDHVDAASVLGILFPTVRDLSRAIRTESGRDLMNAYYRHEETKKLAQFLLRDSRTD